MLRNIKAILTEYGSIIFVIFVAFLLLVNALTITYFYTSFQNTKITEEAVDRFSDGIRQNLISTTSKIFVEIYALHSSAEYQSFSSFLVKQGGFIHAVEVRGSSGGILFSHKKPGLTDSKAPFNALASWRQGYIDKVIQSGSPIFSNPYLRFENQDSGLFPKKYVELFVPTRSNNVFILSVDLNELIDSLPTISNQKDNFVGIKIISPGLGEVASYGLIASTGLDIQIYSRELNFQGLNLSIGLQELKSNPNFGVHFFLISGTFALLLIAAVFKLVQSLSQKNQYLLNLRTQESIMLDQLKMASLGEISTIIAHEINQPLATIEIYLGLMNKALLSEPINSKTLSLVAQSIRNEITRISNIIRNIQSFVTSDSKTNDAVIDVGATLKSLEPILRLQAKNFYCTCKVIVNNNFSATLNLTLLEQVVLNLSRNAFEAMHMARTPVRSLEIIVDWFDNSGRIQFIDTGPGIPEESIDKIGTSFFSTKAQNFGIGLSVCKSMMERYAGNIVWKNNLADGAEFTILLYHAKRISNLQ